MARTSKREQGAKRLSEEDKDRIVELKLNRIPTRRVAAEVGCSANTVTKHWHDWLDDTSAERRQLLERHRSEVIARLDSVATEARRRLVRVAASEMDPADRARAEARFLDAERQALRALSTVAGFDAPTRVVASFDTMTEDEARRLLDDL